MPKVSQVALMEIQDAFEKYREVVEATDMTEKTKRTYLLHSGNFVRWLSDGFTPGINARRQ